MKPVVIDRERALGLLREAVAERGADFRYADHFGDGKCVYVAKGAPACLIGLALHKAGVSISALRRINTVGFIGVAINELPQYVKVNDDAVAVFAYAQTRQDCGQSWGEALKAAGDA